MDKKSKYIFWLDNMSVLYEDNKYLEFFPSSKMTRIEQLNALTRLCIYSIILMLIFKKEDNWLQFPIIGIIFMVILYYMFKFDKQGLYEETESVEKLSNLNNMSDKSNRNRIKREYEKNDEIESGYIDSNNNYMIGKYNGSKRENIRMPGYDLDQYNEYKKNSCRMPTENNPFMNPKINDFELYDPPEPYNVDDDQIKEKINTSFNKNLFRDASDVFEIENSQRQFYTVPSTNPSDQTTFANWLYNSNDICKGDQTKCLKYEDLRYTSGHNFN